MWYFSLSLSLSLSLWIFVFNSLCHLCAVFVSLLFDFRSMSVSNWLVFCRLSFSFTVFIGIWWALKESTSTIFFCCVCRTFKFQFDLPSVELNALHRNKNDSCFYPLYQNIWLYVICEELKYSFSRTWACIHSPMYVKLSVKLNIFARILSIL